MLKVPSELAFIILDYAHYWTERKRGFTRNFIPLAEEWSLDYSAAYPYLCMPTMLDADRQNEPLKTREITFTIVSHDEGWTTEPTKGTCETSSWFEVSIPRPNEAQNHMPGTLFQRMNCRLRQIGSRRKTADSVAAASHTMFPDGGLDLVQRPSSVVEPQKVTLSRDDGSQIGRRQRRRIFMVLTR